MLPEEQLNRDMWPGASGPQTPFAHKDLRGRTPALQNNSQGSKHLQGIGLATSWLWMSQICKRFFS